MVVYVKRHGKSGQLGGNHNKFVDYADDHKWLTAATAA